MKMHTDDGWRLIRAIHITGFDTTMKALQEISLLFAALSDTPTAAEQRVRWAKVTLGIPESWEYCENSLRLISARSAADTLEKFLAVYTLITDGRLSH